ncbi:MAG: superoxide dismutase [Bacteroidales bacterium]|nr:superoxide dismutase [Bacteroidales bacterium]
MQKTFIILLTLLLSGIGLKSQDRSKTVFTFDPLPYAYDALEKAIDAQTMEIHYSRHHRAYYDNFMKAIAGTDLEYMSLGDIMAHISNYPAAVRNNAGGYFNHSLFWTVMSPDGGQPEGALLQALNESFGSLEAFKKQFEQAAATRFGSGWAWLSMDVGGKLFISSTPNQDNPLMDVVNEKGTPILALDVWEHAYYLRYQNKRASYISAFWDVVNWKEVARRYAEAMKHGQ